MGNDIEKGDKKIPNHDLIVYLANTVLDQKVSVSKAMACDNVDEIFKELKLNFPEVQPSPLKSLLCSLAEIKFDSEKATDEAILFINRCKLKKEVENAQ